MKKIYAAFSAAALWTLCVCHVVYGAGAAVIPVGRAVGIQVYTDGLVVIGTSAVNGTDAAANAGIRADDRITEINGTHVTTTEDFVKIINEHPEGSVLTIARDNHEVQVNAVPALGEDGVYRLGLWVRDSCAGVGTVTYYDPASNSFAALGHAINDVDTGNILSVKSGNILACNIVSVTKSERGAPGEINASFGSDRLGDVTLNTPTGLFGKCGADAFSGTPMTVASREQAHEGDAYILSDIFGQSVQEYSVRIEKITDDADRSIVLEITDDRLIDNAGGIVQGMSGSPIIQDGMLVGALTHVFVNSPLKGYGTLVENMLDAGRKA